MGKEKETTALATCITTTMRSNIDIAKDDIIASAISKYESRVDSGLDEVKDTLKRLQADITAVSETINKECTRIADSKLRSDADKIIKVITDTGFTGKSLDAVITANLTSKHDDEECVNIIDALCRITANNSSTYAYIAEKHINIKIPAALKKLIKHKENLFVKLIGAKERQVELRNLQGTGNLDKLGRRMRGVLADSTLETSPEGRAILKELEAAIPVDL